MHDPWRPDPGGLE